jgi:hypothetical protein
MAAVVLAAGVKVQPWVYDPDGTGVSQAAWVTQQGLADAGRSNHALYLTKSAATATNAAAGATVEFSGVLSELGFDYRNDGHCGAGAPRFNVYTTAGTYFFFGCAYGVHTPSTENASWTRVRFGNGDAFPADGVTPWPGFGSVQVTGIDIVFDEGTDVGPGFAYLDNIDVNGILVGKPGNAR